MQRWHNTCGSRRMGPSRWTGGTWKWKEMTWSITCIPRKVYASLARGSAMSKSYRAYIPDRHPPLLHTRHVNFVHKEQKEPLLPYTRSEQMAEHNAHTRRAKTIPASSTPQSTSVPPSSAVNDLRERKAGAVVQVLALVRNEKKLKSCGCTIRLTIRSWEIL